MNEAHAQPSRLELAAKIMAGFAANPKIACRENMEAIAGEGRTLGGSASKISLFWADCLIERAKKAPESK